MSDAKPTITGQEIIRLIDQAVKKEFDTNQRLLSFDEYIALVADKPVQQTRGSARYMLDMMDFFGKEPIKSEPGQPDGGLHSGMYRFHLLDQSLDGVTPRVIGQEAVENQIYNSLRNFSRQNINNKLLLLHGPNGSAKSSIIHSLMAGMESYSKEQEGAIYSFNWIFPVEHYTKGSIGLHEQNTKHEKIHTYARLPDEEVLCRIPCDMHDHPLLLIPLEQRRTFLEKLIGPKKLNEIWNTLPNYLSRGDLCHRCKQIADALLVAYHGDFEKVLMHIQVERFYFSRRYRKGMVTIEPQLHVDAQYQQLTYNKSIGSLPSSLQSLNLFTLTGDLVDSNRGIVEYSDLLKRPIDSFKYLLVACETGSVSVGSCIAYLDTVMLGSTNEVQLDAFKEFPDFTSFKGRIELIRVPYLLTYSQEEEIYQPDLAQIAGEKHVAPHTAWALSLWGVLTRLKKPNSINFPAEVSAIVSNLTPFEKAQLYNHGELPSSLTPEERKLLRSAIRHTREEYINIPYYEGRMGASARELRSVLFNAAQNSEYKCLSPLAVLREIEELVKHVTEYEFLKQDVKDGYHDCVDFINVVRNEYLIKIDREVRDSIGLYDSKQWEDFLRKYVQHISLALKKEKIKNPITGKLEDPDFALIDEFETIVEAPGEPTNRDAFRQNIISQVGAWSLDHPTEQVVYAKVFPEFWTKLEKHYYESQKALLTKMHNALLVYNESQAQVNEEGTKLAEQTVRNMKSKLGYCDHCAKEVIGFLMSRRY